MRYLKREIKQKGKKANRLLEKWEFHFLLTLIVLLVMATIVDLNISFAEILKIIN